MNARVCARSVVLIGLTLSQIAGAQPSEVGPRPESQSESVQDAETALAEAHRLGKRGDTEGACVLFEKSARLAPSADALLNAGICREYRSDWVGALDAFERALEAARARPHQQAAIQPRVDALRPRIPSVTIAPPPTPGTRVEIDARVVPRFGLPLRLNPGEHQLEATAPGAKPHTESFSLMPSQALSLAVPELSIEPPPPQSRPAPSDPIAGAKHAGAPTRVSSGTGAASGWRNPLIYGGIGLFAVASAFSAWKFATMSSARARKHELSDLHGCNIEGDAASSPTCDAGVQRRVDAIYHDEEEPARRLALTGLGMSGVGAAAALIGYFALPEAKPIPAARGLRLEILPGLCKAAITTAW